MLRCNCAEAGAEHAAAEYRRPGRLASRPSPHLSPGPILAPSVSARDAAWLQVLGIVSGGALAPHLQSSAAMGRSSSLAVTDEREDDDFDAPSQIAILRRAIAETDIPSDADRGLRAALRDLTRLSAIAEATVSSIALSDAVCASDELREACSMALFGVQDARRWLERLRAPRPSRTRLETIRHKLHAALSTLGESFAAQEWPGVSSRRPTSELERSLQMRHMVSDFYGAIPRTTNASASRAWALLVANAELKILLKAAEFPRELTEQRDELVALGERIDGWQNEKKPASAAVAALYSELEGVAGVLSSLNARPDVKRHDARALTELSALLSRRTFDDCMTERVVDVLATLRGMDAKLDRLMVALPLEPAAAMVSILRRVTELRARALAS